MNFPTYERQNKWLVDYILPIFTGELHKIPENYRKNRQPAEPLQEQPKQPDELSDLFQPKLTKEGAIDLNFEARYMKIKDEFCLVLPDEPKIRPH